MSKHGISRRHFFVGTLLAGAIPRGGFGSVVSLKADPRVALGGVPVAGANLDPLSRTAARLDTGLQGG